MSGWGDLFKDKYEERIDESTGETIMVEKGTKHHKLDAQGNIVDPDAAPAPSPFAAAFAGGGGSGGGSGGFQFGGAPAGGGGGCTFGGAPSSAGSGGFQFGGAPASSGGGFTFGGGAPAAANGGGGFVFGGGAAAPAAAPAAAATATARSKRPAEEAPASVAKRGRTNALVRTGNESGELLIAGNGDCGQLGFGDEGKRDSVKLLLLPIAAAQICQVACGGLHSIALGLDGRLWSWGCNDDEVLGRPGEEAEPREVGGELAGVPVKSVTCGDNHSAALARDGRVFTWGTYKDSNGYIGYSPDLAKAGQPRRVLPGVTARAIASGTDHTVVVSADGYEVYAWGCNESGQAMHEEEWPTEKADKKKFTAPGAPRSLRLPAPPGTSLYERHARVLNENFRDWVKARLKEDAAWDATEAATLYLEHRAAISKRQAEEFKFDDRLQIKAAFAGAYHTFLLTECENVYSCGLNNMGQLGLGSLDPNKTSTPTLLGGLQGLGVCMLAGGEHHSLALTTRGDVYAFGRGDNHQLGLGDGVQQQPTPTLVAALCGVAGHKIVCGHSHNLVVSRSGDLYAWGVGDMGQLCTGRGEDETAPTLVEGPELASRAVLDASTGGQHSVLVGMPRPS